MPCYAAIRPNSRTLSVHQGKSRNDTAAKLSAIMEAVEFAIAEKPLAPRLAASREALAAADRLYHWPERLLPRNFVAPPETTIHWLEGHFLASGKPVVAPLDSVAIAPNAPEKLPFAQSTNGIGAGFSMPEAIVHALCECVERDGSTLWSLRSLDHCATTAIDLSQIDDPGVTPTLAKLRTSGIEALACDLTSDLGLPTVMTLLWSDTPRHYFDIASGVCAHPDPCRALAGAIEEATQTRISNIAGARDDIDPAEYRAPLPTWLGELILKARPARPLPPALSPEAFADLPQRLDDIIAVPLSAPGADIAVVKVLSSRLEDRATNVHWRPGPRAIKAMSAL